MRWIARALAAFIFSLARIDSAEAAPAYNNVYANAAAVKCAPAAQCASILNIRVQAVAFGGQTGTVAYVWSGSCAGTPDNVYYIQPSGSSPGCFTLLPSFNNNVTTLAALKAIPAAQAPGLGSVMTTGYTAAGDAPPLLYSWVSGSSASNDNCKTITPTDSGGAGRWIAALPQPFNVRGCGVKFDNSTNDSARWQIAVNYQVPLYCPVGTSILGDVVFPNGGLFALTGAGRGLCVLKRLTTAQTIFTVSNVSSPLLAGYMEHLTLDGVQASNTNPFSANSASIRLATGMFTIDDVDFTNSSRFALMMLDSSSATTLKYSTIHDTALHDRHGTMTAALATSGVLTVSAVATGTIRIGDNFDGATVPANNTITFDATSGGTHCNGVACTGAGGTGTYAVLHAPGGAIGSEAMTFDNPFGDTGCVAVFQNANSQTHIIYVDHVACNGPSSIAANGDSIGGFEFLGNTSSINVRTYISYSSCVRVGQSYQGNKVGCVDLYENCVGCKVTFNRAIDNAWFPFGAQRAQDTEFTGNIADGEDHFDIANGNACFELSGRTPDIDMHRNRFHHNTCKNSPDLVGLLVQGDNDGGVVDLDCSYNTFDGLAQGIYLKYVSGHVDCSHTTALNIIGQPTYGFGIQNILPFGVTTLDISHSTFLATDNIAFFQDDGSLQTVTLIASDIIADNVGYASGGRAITANHITQVNLTNVTFKNLHVTSPAVGVFEAQNDTLVRETGNQSADGLSRIYTGTTTLFSCFNSWNNPHFQINIANTNTDNSHTFANAEPDTNYTVSATPVTVAGSPATNAHIVDHVVKTTSAVDVFLIVAPGAATSITYDVIVNRGC